LETNDYKILVDQLMNRIKMLEESHEFNEVIAYYEEKIEELNNKTENSIKTFTKMIESFSSSNSNRDDVWKKAVKKYEERILSLETEINTMKKFERTVYSRQKFFEKYSLQTEEKIEKFSKIQKKCVSQENLLKETNMKIESYERENSELKKENNLLSQKCTELREEFAKMKKFFNEIQPILKIEWQDICNTNKEFFETVSKITDNTDISFHNHNVVKLIDNVKEFIENFQSNLEIGKSKPQNLSLFNLNPVLIIIEDIKKYMIVLLKKVQHLTLNQYHIINIC